MFDEVVKKISESIDESSIAAETIPKFSGEGYKPHRIGLKNFHKIEPLDSGKRIAFVDGGNAEIIGSANFSLNLIRASYAVYQNNRKLAAKKSDGLAFVQAANKNNEIHYNASFFKMKDSVELGGISFSSFDSTLMLGANRVEIGSVANAIRRFAELKLAKTLADSRLADIIVLDGNLQCTLTGEDRYMNELYESLNESNAVLAAISKTSSVFTESGNLLSVVLGSISPFNSWFYHPIAEINNPSHRAEMIFAKFHDKSRHVFRLEIYDKQKSSAEETIGILASNCADAVFMGYPYGLVEADRIARVSNREKESLRTMILAKLKNRNIEKYMSSVNAHEILDRISF